MAWDLKWDVTDDEYYSDTDRISNSSLGVFRASVRRYWATYVDGSLTPPAATDAMDVGSALHMAVLQPDKWAESVVIEPKIDRRTKAGKEAYAQFFGASANAGVVVTDNSGTKAGYRDRGQMVITRDDAQAVMDMAAAIKHNPLAAKLLDPSRGDAELPLTWTDEATTLRCKCKLDLITEDDDEVVIVDLKTAHDATPDGFGRAIVNYGLHHQAAFYSDAVRLMTEKPVRFVWAVFDKAPPHEVILYELDDEGLELGRSENKIAMRRLADCYDFDAWTGHWCNRVTPIALPRYAWNKRLAGPS